MATARLRKTFKYPEDSDSDDDVDEEHQERLIADLEAEDAQKSAFYRQAFLTVPIVGGLFYAFIFIFQAQTVRQRTACLLSLSSLVCSAYILQFLPLPSPKHSNGVSSYRATTFEGPIDKYIVPLNAALAGILTLTAFLNFETGLHTLRDILPFLVFGLTLLVRQQLTPLDLADLQSARFNLKGA